MPIAPTDNELEIDSDELTLADRINNLAELMKQIGPVPEGWLEETKEGGHASMEALNLVECTSYKELINQWRKALNWTEGHDVALNVMLAAAASTNVLGEQLWIKIISPPSGGKTTLVEGLAINTNYVISKSTIRGFHSGHKDESEDNKSLILKVKGKCLATKDGDTLLKSPALPQILSEARDIYDRVSRSDYRNGMGMDHSNIRMTWLLCGTKALREIDSSELGQRFLDCVIMEGIDNEHEDDAALRAVYQELKNVTLPSGEDIQEQYTPALGLAMQMTGGYLEYLCTNINDLISQINVTEEAALRLAKYGKFVAFMRARPSKDGENHERELCFRLAKQTARLASFIPVVLNERNVDIDTVSFKRVHKVAMDTSRGITLDIARELYKSPEGCEPQSLVYLLNKKRSTITTYLHFLRDIGAVQLNEAPSPIRGIKSKQHLWQLTPLFRDLYKQVAL